MPHKPKPALSPDFYGRRPRKDSGQTLPLLHDGSMLGNGIDNTTLE